LINGFLLPGEQSHSELGLWIVKAAREPVVLIIENIGDADFLLIAVGALYRSRENPRVAVDDWAFAALLEE
jgi:hypothetical protein